MEVGKGYKQTEIGVLPQDWSTTLLCDVCVKIRDGNYGFEYPKSHEFISYGVPFLTSKAIGKDGTLKEYLIDYISAEKHVSLDKAHIELNDVLFTNRGASVGAIGFVDQRIAGGNIGPQLTLLRANLEFVISKYLFYAMKSGAVQKQIQSQDSGSAMNFYSIAATEKFILPLPPTLAEQEAIAEALSDADALIESLETLLAKKRQVKQGAMSELLSGKRRLVESEWEVKKLGDVIKEIGDGATPSTSNPLNFGGSINWAVIEDIQDEITTTKNTLTERGLKSCPAKLWSAGTLIVSTGATIGEVGIAKIPLATKQGICGLVIDQAKANTHFIKYWFMLNRNNLLQKAQGSTIKEVRAPTLVQFEVLLPSLTEQNTIAEILSDMDAEIRALEGKLSKVRAVKAGMMSELLTGRTRLV